MKSFSASLKTIVKSRLALITLPILKDINKKEVLNREFLQVLLQHRAFLWWIHRIIWTHSFRPGLSRIRYPVIRLLVCPFTMFFFFFKVQDYGGYMRDADK